MANRNSNNVSLVDSEIKEIIGVINVNSSPEGLKLNAASGHIFVANSNTNNVSVIDTATNAVINTLNTGEGPNGIAVNVVTNVVYVSNTLSNSITVIQDTGTGNPPPGGGNEGDVASMRITPRVSRASRVLKPAVIRVLDEDGNPVENATVTAIGLSLVNITNTLVFPRSQITNEEGRAFFLFRFKQFTNKWLDFIYIR